MSNEDKEKNDDVKVPIVDPDEKQDQPEEEPTEKSPLKPENGDVQKSTDKLADIEKNQEDEHNSDAEEDQFERLRMLLAQPKPTFVAVTVAVISFAVVSIILVVIAASSGDGHWQPDSTPRMLRLIPAPNGPGNLIRYRAGHDSDATWSTLTDQIIEQYQKYSFENLTRRKSYTTCDNRPPASRDLTCFYSAEPVKLLCNDRDNFGYPDARPCLLVQVDTRHLRDWKPETYTPDDLKMPGLPDGVKNNYRFIGPYIECHPNTIIDRENAGGISVAPGNEISQHYFPDIGHRDYMAPFVAIRLDKPTSNVVVGLTCRLWARNVGGRLELDPVTNETKTIWPETPLPDAELPFNILVE